VTGSSLADVFGQPMHEPIPDRLLAVITAGGHRTPAARERQVRPAEQQTTGVFDAIAEALFPRGLGFASAFTLTAFVAAVGTAGYLVGRVGTSSEGASVVAAGELKVALETQPSLSDKIAIGSGAALWPAASFKSHDRSFCREYKIAGRDGNGFAGVACRGPDSQWRVAVHSELKMPLRAEVQDADKPGPTQKYSSAGDQQSPAVEAAVNRLKQGDVFGPVDEAAAIAKGWSEAK
jgi:surface antigen